MRGTNFSIIRFQEELKRIIKHNTGISIYIFGSASRQAPNPQDIDLLIIYDSAKNSFNQLQTLKQIISNYISDKYGLSVDFCTLNLEESMNSNFVCDEKAIHLFTI